MTANQTLYEFIMSDDMEHAAQWAEVYVVIAIEADEDGTPRLIEAHQGTDTQRQQMLAGALSQMAVQDQADAVYAILNVLPVVQRNYIMRRLRKVFKEN